MKRLLLLPILCLMPAAQAVDYVKCEAIQKANERARQSSRAIYDNLRSQYFPSIKEEICGPEPDFFSFDSSSDPLGYSQASLAWTQCETFNSDEIYAQLRALMNVDPDYKKAKARVAKIQADYDAEGCY